MVQLLGLVLSASVAWVLSSEARLSPRKRQQDRRTPMYPSPPFFRKCSF
jgi:hypothetical protein